MNPPIILIGYEGSQRIVPISNYLTSKYLKKFQVTYLNYIGEINGWSKFISDYLKTLTDENIIFALDDYLVADYMSMKVFYSALSEIGDNVVCVKLCNSTPREHFEYPITTQYCIWNREYLIDLLREVSTPWEFELHGSKIFGKVCLHRPCLEYFTNSSVSSRWEGVRLDGLKQEDIKYIHENKLV